MSDLSAPNTQRGTRTLTIVSLIFAALSPLIGLVLALVDWARSRRRGAVERTTIVSLGLNGVMLGFNVLLLFLLPWMIYLVGARGSGLAVPSAFEYSVEAWSIIFG
ncbi:hypothetical protein [Homoserinimonas sp. A520]